MSKIVTKAEYRLLPLKIGEIERVRIVGSMARNLHTPGGGHPVKLGDFPIERRTGE
jgi:hypothetical protein